MAEVFDIDEACTYLKLAKPTLYKYVRVGAIPAFKMGRVWRFHKQVLENWVKQRVETDTTARTKRSRLAKSH
ncbi:helix-turn-helix domain-containing protein [Estrella lausannensis]|uniref:Putative excisionase n=1 Tax=Estrella lausannensis TaxID=483423 RepID=A0A0H5E8C6_9BACT|nr:helix-turn-helix domain-containing protein [Estrella lausannensis]CRX39590.1 Putative excisionase [Estrella lausannensis]